MLFIIFIFFPHLTTLHLHPFLAPDLVPFPPTAPSHSSPTRHLLPLSLQILQAYKTIHALHVTHSDIYARHVRRHPSDGKVRLIDWEGADRWGQGWASDRDRPEVEAGAGAEAQAQAQPVEHGEQGREGGEGAANMRADEEAEAEARDEEWRDVMTMLGLEVV